MKINFFKRKKESLRIKLIKELTYTHGYSILTSSKTLKDDEFMLNLAKQYDEYGYMSEELGRELDSLFSDDDYIIGIHRTGYNYIDEEMLSEFFNRGLINNGHIMQGGMDGNLDIEKTVTLFNDFVILNGQLKAAHGYKGSQGCIIVKIPKSYLGRKDGEMKPIYYMEGSVVKLLPEFIYGYVPVDKEGRLGEIIHNPNYSDIHNLNNVNLIYDQSVFFKAKREGIELNKDISIDEKYRIIQKAYIDTLSKYGSKQAEHALLSLINNNDVKYFTGQDNRALLSKCIIFGDILSILAISNGLDKTDINAIINSFINDCNVVLGENNKSK